MTTRLISFLGTTAYDEVTYVVEGSHPVGTPSPQLPTKFVVKALADIYSPDEVHIIATKESLEANENEVRQALGGLNVQFIQISTGASPDELWELFSKLVASIQDGLGKLDQVLVDITLGFRMQPFFASSCIQYVQSVMPNSPQIRVFYAELNKSDKTGRIWELTTFIDVLSWSQGISTFLSTGNADHIVRHTDQINGRISTKMNLDGYRGPVDSYPKLHKISAALQKFSDDFTAVRTGSLLAGGAGRDSTAQQLYDAIQNHRQDAAKHLKVLDLVLNQVQEMVKPLLAKGQRFSTKPGQIALHALASLYLTKNRLSESISVLREGWFSMGAAEADMPGKGCTKENRDALTQTWINRHDDKQKGRQSRDVSVSIFTLRNDIQHAGFVEAPLSKSKLRESLTEHISRWRKEIDNQAENKKTL